MAKPAADPPPIKRDEHWWRLPVGAPVHKRVVPYGLALLQRESNFHRKNLARERIYRGVIPLVAIVLVLVWNQRHARWDAAV